MKPNDALMVAAGFVAIFLGAMPLDGYFLYLCDPGSFHQDALVGSVWHLRAGVVPWGAGILLLAFSRVSTRQVFLVAVCSIAAGLFVALPAILTARDHQGWLGWLSIAALGCVLAGLIHAASGVRSRCRR